MGIDATGLDISPAQCTAARNRWGHLPGATFVPGDAASYLTETTTQWDAIYSIWGAVWFTDPARLLPLIRDRLTPTGKLAFSHAPPVPGSYGIQGMYGNGFTGRQTWIYRWAYEPATWADLLHQTGFSHIHTRTHPAPDPDNVGTLIVEATGRRHVVSVR
jgi:SAM-dependent methyltransferase